MIRLTYLLRRRAGMTLIEFQQGMLESYGPLLARYARDLRIVRAMQVHTLDEPGAGRLGGTRGEMEPPYDAVVEAWWWHERERDAALATAAGEAAIAALIEAERELIDLPNSSLWFNYEYPQVNPSPENLLASERSSLVKLYYPLRHVASLSLDEAQLYWRAHHGPIIRSQAAASRILRYVQVHRYPDPLEARWREQRGTAVEPYTGHAELWFDRNEFGASGPERTAAGRRAEDDERNFIDFARSTMWWAKEYVIADYR